MILIVTALKAEAGELIKRLKLKHRNAPFPLYENDDTVLIISGVGKEKCAVAVGWAFGEYKSFNGALNLGCAGGLDDSIAYGTLCLSSIIVSENESKVYIPDIFYKHNAHECKLCTYTHTVSNSSISEKNVICDMEAYGFATAAAAFITNDRYACLKLISDNARGNKSVSSEDIAELFFDKADDILSFLDSFKQYCTSCAEKQSNSFSDTLNIIADKYSLTEARKNILKTELRNTFAYYGSVPDINKLPELEGKEKKHSAKAFDTLLYNLKHNINCVFAGNNNIESTSQRSFFNHVYVEEAVADTEYVKDVLNKLNGAEIVKIPSYKAVFCRKKQNMRQQARNKNLILARATGELLYKGSDYCNAFGFDRFYYCSSVMGCIYNCAYCYLQGMYSSSHITAFVNTEDFFSAIDNINDGGKMLICCSYDSDLLALDGILDTIDKWLDFASSRPNITFEIRTKSAVTLPFKGRAPVDNVIIAYTLSPDSIAKEYELYTPAPSARLNAAKQLALEGWRIRLCIEPVLPPVVDEQLYFELADEIAATALSCAFEDAVIGGFRMNTPYFKRISELSPYCKLFANPFLKEHDGGMLYDASQNIVKRLAKYIEQKTKLHTVCFEYDTKMP